MIARGESRPSSPTRVLYVTSFSPDLYLASGRRLVQSFLRHDVEGRLLCCHEGRLARALPPRPPRLLTYDLDGDPFLAGWLRTNRDIIPRHLGGTARSCGCPRPDDPWAGDHRPGCTGQWFNKNASRWFRKIVALAHALTVPCDVVVWLDADCRFRRPLPAARTAAWFRGRDVFYLQSRQRRFPETGVMGFHLGRRGRRFVEALIERYRSGAFRRDDRWDDCAQFHRTRLATRSVRCVDLATRASGDAHVVRHSPVGRYLHHDKGRHGGRLHLMW